MRDLLMACNHILAMQLQIHFHSIWSVLKIEEIMNVCVSLINKQKGQILFVVQHPHFITFDIQPNGFVSTQDYIKPHILL